MDCLCTADSRDAVYSRRDHSGGMQEPPNSIHMAQRFPLPRGSPLPRGRPLGRLLAVPDPLVAYRLLAVPLVLPRPRDETVPFFGVALDETVAGGCQRKSYPLFCR